MEVHLKCLHKSRSTIDFRFTSKPLFLTSNSMSYFWLSHMYMRSKYSLQICLRASKTGGGQCGKVKCQEVLSRCGHPGPELWETESRALLTSSILILMPLSRSHLSPSSLYSFWWYSLQICTRPSEQTPSEFLSSKNSYRETSRLKSRSPESSGSWVDE